MTRFWRVTIGACVVACLPCLALGCAGVPQPAIEPSTDGGNIPKQLQTRQVIVTLPPASPERWAQLTNAIAQAYHLPQAGAFPLTSLGVQCVVFQVPEGQDVKTAMARLTADPRVESLQPNHVFQGLGVRYNDPYATLQYGARSIRADVAHRWATRKGVKVAVIDTGVDVEHPDLHGRILQTVNFVEGGEQTFKQDGHGTAVSGVIAARANNHIGIYGIAPDADIVAIKACWQRLPGALEAVCSSWTLAKAVDYAIVAGVQVLNLSLVGPPDPLLARLIARAAESGITAVAAALGGEQAPGFPASLEAVLGVLASDPHGQRRAPAQGEGTPLLAAPGIDILTTVPRQISVQGAATELALVPQMPKPILCRSEHRGFVRRAAHTSRLVAATTAWQGSDAPPITGIGRRDWTQYGEAASLARRSYKTFACGCG
jgi:subtilisin family serine protease